MARGSALSNWAGILSAGLKIAPPEAPANGYNFDKGLYFADVAEKSKQYCRPPRDGPAVLCLADVALGKQLVKRAPDVNANNARVLASMDSVQAIGLQGPDPEAGTVDHHGAAIPLGETRTARATGDADRQVFMGHNEFIVYETARHQIKYVLQCTST